MTLERMEERIGELLSVGTAISTVLLAAGLVLYFAGVQQSLAMGMLNAGLVVLIATPVGRVVASAIGFALQRDWWMVTLTSLVLASLLLSFIIAFRRS